MEFLINNFYTLDSKNIFSSFPIYQQYSIHDKFQIARALDFAEKAHSKEKRENGDDYITHPIAVAKIIMELNVIPEIVISALLHDVLEDTPVNFEEMHHEFGFHIAKIVNMLSKSYKIKILDHNSDEERKLLHHYFLETISDPKAAIIKIADRLHNMRTLEYTKVEKQKRKSLETIKIYVPLALEMGLPEISKELEEIAKKYLTKEEYVRAKEVSINYDKEIQEKGYHKNAIEKCVMEVF